MDAHLFAGGQPLPEDDGYRSIWYCNQPSGDEYRYKYSGGLATYPQQHVNLAAYSEAANKTFFCYGGRSREKNELLHMVSYYDHATGLVPKPRILLNKLTNDAHDNPTMALDKDGHIWIFSNAHGRSRNLYLHRSVEPYSIDRFEHVLTTNFSYSQPWYIAAEGFLVLHTRYSEQGHRRLYWMTSPDGFEWTAPELLAHMDKGHYQISWRTGSCVGTAFNYHPEPVGLNARTNLYYVQTSNIGKSWQTASGETIATPVTVPDNRALVHDYAGEGLLVYIKHITFDGGGRPIILYVTSKGFESGPGNDPRTWCTAHWTGLSWDIRRITTSDSNYDHGVVTVDDNGTWRVLGATEPGPQVYNPGGELALWLSSDEGATWWMSKQLTRNSDYNHTYPKTPVNGHPAFYSLWADGHARQESESRLYFTDRDGSSVWMLPQAMTTEFAEPEVVS